VLGHHPLKTRRLLLDHGLSPSGMHHDEPQA
jgi:hypothetical protein